jgi:hypothetical protein
VIQNLNPDFNAMRHQTIMESIERKALEGSPLTTLAYQGTEVVNYVIEERPTSNPQGKPSVDNRSNNRKKRA